MPDLTLTRRAPDHGHAHDGHLPHRHDHEAEVYDAMAAEVLATWRDDDHLVDPAVIPFVNREQTEYLSHAVAQLGPLAGRRVLEVGVGSGSLAVWLAQQGASVVGIDISGGILEVARRRAEVNGVGDRLQLVHSPVETFDPAAAGVGGAPFDAIIGNNVVHHFERGPAADNLARLLAPGAVAAFCEPVLFLPEWMKRARNSALVTRRFPMHTHTPDEKALDQGDLALLRSRFRHVEWQPFQVTCRLQNFVELTDPTWNRLEALDRRLLRAVPALRAVCRIAVLTLALPHPAGGLPTTPTERQ